MRSLRRNPKNTDSPRRGKERPWGVAYTTWAYNDRNMEAKATLPEPVEGVREVARRQNENLAT